MYCGDEVAAIVSDIGYSNARFGYAGEDIPKVHFSAEIGHDKDAQSNNIMNEWAISDPELSKFRPGLIMKHAVNTTGCIEHWDALEQLWNRAFEYLTAGPSATETSLAGGHGVILSESVWTSQVERAKTIELMFETFQIPSLFISKSASLAAFACGRSTSLVVDFGAGGTSVVPVLDGYVLNKPSQRIKRGGEWLTKQVCQLLDQDGINVNARYLVPRNKRTAQGELTTNDEQIPQGFEERCKLKLCEIVKKDVCGLPLVLGIKDVDLGPHLPVAGMPNTCDLPDGTTVNLSASLYRIPEMLFSESELNPDASNQLPCPPGWNQSLQSCIHTTLERCDVDIRKEMMSSILITGAGSQFKYLSEHLQKRMAVEIGGGMKIRVVSSPDTIEKRFGVWIGGSILASLGSFQQLWLSKTEYDELGSTAAQRRFLEAS